MIGDKVYSIDLGKKFTFLFLFLFNLHAFSQDFSQKNIEEIKNQISELKRDVKSAVNDAELIKRDQLNYSIEKNLLKEVYGSNIETIQLFITIILGIFTILGFIGLRNVQQIRDFYTKELDELKSLKSNLEEQYNLLVEKHRNFEEKVVGINDKQDKRLKVLEVLEKARNNIGSGQWTWALEYINYGLQIEPDNYLLLESKTFCLAKLNKLGEAVLTWKRSLQIPNLEELERFRISANILEYLALENSKGEFESRLLEFEMMNDRGDKFALIAYLKTLSFVSDNNLDAAKIELLKYANEFKNTQINHLMNWQFDEITEVIKSWDENRRNFLNNMMSFFKGNMSSNDFINYLNNFSK